MLRGRRKRRTTCTNGLPMGRNVFPSTVRIIKITPRPPSTIVVCPDLLPRNEHDLQNGYGSASFVIFGGRCIRGVLPVPISAAAAVVPRRRQTKDVVILRRPGGIVPIIPGVELPRKFRVKFPNMKERGCVWITFCYHPPPKWCVHRRHRRRDRLLFLLVLVIRVVMIVLTMVVILLFLVVVVLQIWYMSKVVIFWVTAQNCKVFFVDPIIARSN